MFISISSFNKLLSLFSVVLFISIFIFGSSFFILGLIFRLLISGLIIGFSISFLFSSRLLVLSFKLLFTVSIIFSFFDSILFDDVLMELIIFVLLFIEFVIETFLDFEISFISFVSLFVFISGLLLILFNDKFVELYKTLLLVLIFACSLLLSRSFFEVYELIKTVFGICIIGIIYIMIIVRIIFCITII